MKLNIILIINSLLLILFLFLSFSNYSEVYVIFAYLLTGLLFIISTVGCINYKTTGYICMFLSILSCGFLTYIQIIN